MHNLEVSIFLYALKRSKQQWYYLGYADRNLGLVRFVFFQRKIGSFAPCLLRSVWIDCLFLAQVSVLSKALTAAPMHSTKSLPMVLLMCCWSWMFTFLLPPPHVKQRAVHLTSNDNQYSVFTGSIFFFSRPWLPSLSHISASVDSALFL